MQRVKTKRFGVGICLGFWILISICTPGASASYISLDVTLSSKIEAHNLKVKVRAVNKGDEPAYNVLAELWASGEKLLADRQDELKGYGAYRAEMAIPLSVELPGTYPLILLMHYTDGNGYPFSALTGQTFVYQREEVSPAFGWLKSSSFTEAGDVYLTLKNLGNRELNSKVYLVLPNELTVNENVVSVRLAPASEQSVKFTVKNFSALPGSAYQALAVAEFEDQNIHFTGVSSGTIKILSSRGTIFGLPPTVVIAILTALILVLFAVQFKRQ
ncbi:hypothetical protein HZB08_01670 [Candidatus Saganbacteria bacterium]|uniref:Uncharacterized protein n=1 Tax=Candidatus Saganbacteria bacterium TaxID=2575572 RepID=A0A9D6UP11_UNCSA|nr:hypothetical protein [Candidatus Saganbacteria bacterium]